MKIPNVDKVVKNFQLLIDSKGHDMLLYKHSRCACLLRDGRGQPDATCKACAGSGINYDAIPIELKAIVQYVNKDIIKNLPVGYSIDKGTCQITVPADTHMTIDDKLVSKHIEITMNEVLTSNEIGLIRLLTTPLKMELCKAYIDKDRIEEIKCSIIDTNVIKTSMPNASISVRYIAKAFFYVTNMMQEFRGIPISSGFYKLPISVMAQRGDYLTKDSLE